jgi:hypothetical protein
MTSNIFILVDSISWQGDFTDSLGGCCIGDQTLDGLGKKNFKLKNVKLFLTFQTKVLQKLKLMKETFYYLDLHYKTVEDLYGLSRTAMPYKMCLCC